jgi:Arc/MetJ family transcription regulator
VGEHEQPASPVERIGLAAAMSEALVVAPAADLVELLVRRASSDGPSLRLRSAPSRTTAATPCRRLAPVCIYLPIRVYLEVLMTKRLIDVDDAALEAARRVLGTDTMKDTVNAALRASVQAAERRQHVDAAALQRFAGASRDLRDDDVMADAWR